MFVVPVYKGLKFIMTSPRLTRNRSRAVLASCLVVMVAGVLIGWVPVPLSTLAEGVIWVPEKSFVRAGADGFVEKIIAAPGSTVRKGDPLIQCSDPLLPAQIRLLEAQKREMEVVYNTQSVSDRVKAQITKEELRHIAAKLVDARERAKELMIISGTDGAFLLPMAKDLPSVFVRRGQLLGYVMNRSAITARVVVSQADVDAVRRRTLGVSVRLPENLATTLPSVLRREVPAATDQLPGRALSQEGGGEIAIDPRDGFGNKAFQKIFLFDIELPSREGIYHVGSRVHVRFNHGREPIFRRWYNGLRQLFLRRFNV
jgi:putative peptide zinc metalloprotease protein